MLNVLRKNSQHWLVMAIIVVVIVGLAFFFGYSSRDTASGQTWAAKVDGQTIKMGEFLTRYRNIVERYRQQFGASFDEKMLEAFNLRGRILQEMVYDVIIAKEAEKNDFFISDEELRETIASVPYFQKDGKFNLEYYKSILNYNRTSPQEFEKAQNDELIKRKLHDFISASAKASDDEVVAQHKIDNDKRSISFFRLELPTANKIEVSNKEVNEFLASSYGKKQAESYYTANNDSFKNGDKIITFEEAKNNIAKDLLLKQKKQDMIEKLTAEALKMNDISKAASVFKQKVGDSGQFSRSSGSLPSFAGSNANDVIWSFGLNKGKLYSRQIAGVDYVVALNKEYTDNFNTNSKDFNSYKDEYISKRGNQEYAFYLQELNKEWLKKVKYSPALSASFNKQD